MRDTYGKQKLDLVIVASYPALSFAVEFRERIFPGVPIVFMSVAPGRIQGRKLWSGVTGVTIPSDIRGTLELALRLQPDTKNVAVVAGDSEFERYWLGLTNQELGLHAGQLKVIDLVGLPVDQLLRKVSQLPRHTVIFFQLIPQESTQTVIGTMTFWRRSRNSSRPTASTTTVLIMAASAALIPTPTSREAKRRGWRPASWRVKIRTG